MSQQVKIERDLVFRENAQHTGNVKGRFSFANKVVWYDDFVGKAIDSTYDYTFEVINSGTATIVAPHLLTLTTGAADFDDAEFAMGLDFYGQYNAVIEVRCRIDDIAATAINVGFNDAQAEGSANEIAIMLTGGTPTVDKATDNCALFVADADATTYGLFAWSTKGGSDGSVITTGIIPTNSMWMTFRVELQDDGSQTNAAFYANSTGLEINPATDLVGFELDAIERATVVCPYIALINHPGTADTFSIDYIKIWQDRY